MFWSDAHSQRQHCLNSCSQKLPFETSLDLPIAFNLAVSDDWHSHYLEKSLVFSLFHTDLLDSRQRLAVKANIDKLVTGSFLHFKITTSLQKLSVKVICVPLLRSACWTCLPICCVMDCCCNFYDHVTSFLCDLKKIPPVLRSLRSMFMLKCSWMWYLRKG